MSNSITTELPPLSAKSPAARREAVTACLLGAGYQTGNCGVAALASGTVNAIRQQWPAAKIFLLDYGYEPRQHTVHCATGAVTVELVNLRFSKRVWLPNNIARLLLLAGLARGVPVQRWRRSILQRNPILRRICEADFIGSLAGGDSFSDIYGLGRLVYVTLPQLLVLWLGKPLHVLPQTVGPFRSWVGRWLARYVLRRAEAVYLRDADDAEAVAARGRPVEQSFDMAFVLEPVPPPRSVVLPSREGNRPLVGLNVSGLLWMGGYTRDNMFGLRSPYRETIRALIRQFGEAGAQVLLVPHVYGGEDNPENDLRAARALFEELRVAAGDRLYLLDGEHDHQVLKHIIGQCDFFVGARMHACIAALSQGIPAVGLAYSRKFTGVFQTVGAGDLVVDLRQQDTDGILAQTGRAYRERARWRERLAQQVPVAQRAVVDLFAAAASAAALQGRGQNHQAGGGSHE